VKNKFSVTISDVHGSKSYSFNQLIRKFFLVITFVVLFVFAAGVLAIWWLDQEVTNVEEKMVIADLDYQRMLDKRQADYFKLVNENKEIQLKLDNKLKQVQFLDQTLQGLEELIDVERDENIPVEDRVKLVQLSTIEKQIMLKEIPNGRPVKNFKGVSSSYGWRHHPVTGKKHFHRGIDYRGKKGDPIIATAEGVVEYAGFHKKSGYGNLIIISHNNGFKTFYGHLSKLRVKTGQVVLKGELIGDIGSTGRSSGPHLHYEISFVQRKLNPTAFVEWGLEDYNQIFEHIKGVPWGSLTQKIQKHVQIVEKQLSLRDVK